MKFKKLIDFVPKKMHKSDEYIELLRSSLF